MGKPFYFNLPPDIGFTLFTPIKGRIDSLTGTCTNILRYNPMDTGYVKLAYKLPFLLGIWNNLRGIVIKQRH